MHGRNKKCVTLNLKAPEAREIALGLAVQADAVVENFRPGLMERFGLGPDAIAAVRPGCVLARISGYGQTGPYRMMPAFGMIGEAKGGIRHLTGYPKEITDLPPVRTGVALADSLAGLYAAFGVLAALYERRTHPPGTTEPSGVRIVDVALAESVFSFLDSIVPEYGFSGAVRQPAGSFIPTAAPTNAYRSRDGAWVLIGANSTPLFARLTEVMGHPELAANPDHADNERRVANVAALDAEITAWTENPRGRRDLRPARRGRHPVEQDLRHRRHRRRPAIPGPRGAAPGVRPPVRARHAAPRPGAALRRRRRGGRYLLARPGCRGA